MKLKKNYQLKKNLFLREQKRIKAEVGEARKRHHGKVMTSHIFSPMAEKRGRGGTIIVKTLVEYHSRCW